MKKESILTLAAVFLIILGIGIAAIGLSGATILLPPVITGIGFFVIAWGFFAMRKS